MTFFSQQQKLIENKNQWSKNNILADADISDMNIFCTCRLGKIHQSSLSKMSEIGVNYVLSGAKNY